MGVPSSSGPLAGVSTPARTPKTAVHDVNDAEHTVESRCSGEEQFSRWGLHSLVSR